jgi:hypothetical protein
MKLLNLLLLALTVASAHAAPPVVSNVRASQRTGTHYVDIYYSVSSTSSPLTIYVAMSADSGTTWNVPVFSVQGAVGPGVTPGNDRYIQWNAGADWPGQFSSQCMLRITADDGTAPSVPKLVSSHQHPRPFRDATIRDESLQRPEPVYRLKKD